MFSATITGQIQRIVYDNGKSNEEAMVKVVLAVPKQYSKDPKTRNIFPLITIWGYDAQYLRNYAGKGQIISCINCEAEYYENDKFEDGDGNHPETVSFRAGKVMFPKADIMKALVDAGVAEEGEGGDDDDEEEDSKSRRRKKSKEEKKRGKSRSERRRSRSRDDDDDEDFDDDDYKDDEDEEEEKPRKSKKSKDSKKKSSSKKGKKKVDDDDDDYEDDYDDDYDDDYFDDED